MPSTVKKISTLDVQLPTEPGALARIYSAFAEKKINVSGSWGYEMAPGKAAAHFYVQTPEPARETLTKMGFKVTTTEACWAEGSDKAGAYAELLAKVAKAGVNIGSTDALAIGGKFTSVIYPADAKDFPKLAKALGC